MPVLVNEKNIFFEARRLTVRDVAGFCPEKKRVPQKIRYRPNAHSDWKAQT
jgi:hypothetical protein